jgi:hypothetical protein
MKPAISTKPSLRNPLNFLVFSLNPFILLVPSSLTLYSKP